MGQVRNNCNVSFFLVQEGNYEDGPPLCFHDPWDFFTFAIYVFYILSFTLIADDYDFFLDSSKEKRTDVFPHFLVDLYMGFLFPLPSSSVHP